MSKCLICRENKNDKDFNDEHIIPDSIGGKIHYSGICKECNQKCGEKIDVELTDNVLVMWAREKYNLKGKKEKRYCALERLKFKNKAEKPVKMIKKENGEYELKEPAYVEKDIEIEGRLNISFAGEDKEEVINLLMKKLEREKISKEKINEIYSEIVEKEKNIVEIPLERGKLEVILTDFENRREVTARKKMDLGKLNLALLKIAFEFLAKQDMDFAVSDEAKIISNLIFQYINAKNENEKNNILEKVRNKNELYHEVTDLNRRNDCIEIIKNFEKELHENLISTDNHIIMAIYAKDEIIVIVKIFSNIKALYILSNNNYGKIGYNIEINEIEDPINNKNRRYKILEKEETYKNVVESLVHHIKNRKYTLK